MLSAYASQSADDVINSNPSAHQFVPPSITKYWPYTVDGRFDGSCVADHESDGITDGNKESDGSSDGIVCSGVFIVGDGVLVGTGEDLTPFPNRVARTKTLSISFLIVFCLLAALFLRKIGAQTNRLLDSCVLDNDAVFLMNELYLVVFRI